jgi:hypothetical protein
MKKQHLDKKILDEEQTKKVEIGYCCYCNAPIKDGDDYVMRDGKYYDLDCYNQMTTFFDDSLLEDDEQ